MIESQELFQLCEIDRSIDSLGFVLLPPMAN